MSTTTYTTRAEAISRIRAGLKRRSGKAWSVTGGRGTGWGWLRITSPPKRRDGSLMSDQDRADLADLLGIPVVYSQGVNVPSGGDYWDEFIDRAEGRTPTKYGVRYWD